MRQSDRRKILWFLVLLFVVVGGAAIFYAQGYRLNLFPLGIQKIGGIYFRSSPSEITVSLDGRQVEKTRHFFGTSFLFFQGGTLINDLFPGKYVLSLAANDYENWEQTLEVKPSLVTELKYAVLVPKTTTAFTTSSVINFWTAGENIVLQNQSGTLVSNSKTLPGTNILDKQIDGQVLIADFNKNIFEVNLNSGRAINVTALLRANEITGAQFSKILLEQGENGVVLMGTKNIYVLNLDSGSLQTAHKVSPTSTSVLVSIASSPDYIISSEYDGAKNSSFIFVYDKNSRNKFGYVNPLPGKTVAMEWQSGRLGLVQSDGSFFLGDPRQANGLLKTASDALGFSFSGDSGLVAVLEKRALEIFPLNESFSENYARFELPDSQSIRDISWYKDGQHLFIHLTDSTMFLDIGDKLLEHYLRVGDAGSEYDSVQNRLYFKNGNNLLYRAFPG